MVLEDIAKFPLISTGMGFCCGEFIQFEDHFRVFLMIQGRVLSRLLSCVLFIEIFDSLRVDFIQRPKDSIDFFLFFKMLLVFRVEDRRASFSHLSCRGASQASAYKLSIEDVLKAPRTCLRPSWCMGSS